MLLKKNYLIFLLLVFSQPYLLRATEGMWLPTLLNGALESDMQTMGMQISAEDIYNINQSSLKDAIVNFGGCTGSMISPEGLLLTNHHCGYSLLQSHSTLENDLLENGFWAKDITEELPNPSLSVYFVRQIEDVTAQALSGVEDDMPEIERQELIQRRIDSLNAAFTKDTHLEAITRPFYYGNQYFLFLIEVFRDVRLVGAPPSSIGKFGGDTDNWMWPRHTGDFALFRIYASPDGKPAEYSEDNVPYEPRHHLPINTTGVSEGDFTMVFGFPGRTNEYLVSAAVDNLVNVINPHRIRIRESKLAILEAAMNANDTIRLQYAAKYARTSNYYKKWIGENMGLKNFNAVQKKQDLERRFQTWAEADEARREEYGVLLDQFNDLYSKQQDAQLVDTYLREAVYGIELFSMASRINRMIGAADKLSKAEADDVISYVEGFYKNYRPATDKAIFTSLMDLYVKNVPADYVPQELLAVKNDGLSIEDYAENLYQSSLLTNQERLTNLLEKNSKKNLEELKKDPALLLQAAFFNIEAVKAAPVLMLVAEQLSPLYRTYMRGLMEMQPDKLFYPDANGTMRISYGRLEGSSPRDGMKYLPFTTLHGVMQKEDPDDKEFIVPEKLKTLYKRRDLGGYAPNDTLYVNFLASNHTTGGNSGSPVIDARGALIGLNFDRTWESTMSDVMYDPQICRNISVDIRYILFLIDEYAEADHLLEEMTLVEEEEEVEIINN